MYDDSDEGEIMWEILLAGRPSDLIAATCCARKEEPMLCLNVGDKRPRLIPWACARVAECQHCGILKKLKIPDCRTLSECDISIPVSEWMLMPRSGANKKTGKQNTQLELNLNEETLRVVICGLVEQLEKCRKHYTETSWLNLVRKLDAESLE